MNNCNRHYFLIISIILLLISCENDINDEEPIGIDVEPVFEFTNIHSFYREAGYLKFERYIPKLVKKPNGDEEYPEGINVVLYREDGVSTTTLKADKGNYDKKLDLYIVRGKCEGVKQNIKEDIGNPSFSME